MTVKQQAVTVLCLVFLVIVGTFFVSKRMDKERAEATKLSQQHRIAIMKLERERQECTTQDACCSDKVTLQRENLELRFQLQCYPKFGKDECDHAFLRAPEFDTAGVI